MAFLRKKRSVIDRRLKEIEREKARVNSELKAISRVSELRVPDGSGLKRGTQFKAAGDRGNGGQPARSATLSVAGGPAWATPGRPGEAEGKAARHADGSLSSSRVGARDRGAISGREKFVSYFAAGHFQHFRPLRQENHVLRNKAIMMLILVILAAIGLFHFLWR